MCNLSENVEKRGIAKSLIIIMKKSKFSFEQALDYLDIDPSEHDFYKQLVEQIQKEYKKA